MQWRPCNCETGWRKHARFQPSPPQVAPVAFRFGDRLAQGIAGPRRLWRVSSGLYGFPLLAKRPDPPTAAAYEIHPTLRAAACLLRSSLNSLIRASCILRMIEMTLSSGVPLPVPVELPPTLLGPEADASRAEAPTPSC